MAKKITKINESDLINMVKEAINELSPEFLAHAARMADVKGRERQHNSFSKGAKRAWNKEYAFDAAPNAEKGIRHLDDKFSFANGTLRNDVDNYSYYPDDAVDIANRKFRSAKRNKVEKGVKSIKNMADRLDPQGNRYPDEEYDDNLNESIRKSLRSMIK